MGLRVPGPDSSSREKLIHGSSSQGQIPVVKGEPCYRHRLPQRRAEPCVLKITIITRGQRSNTGVVLACENTWFAEILE